MHRVKKVKLILGKNEDMGRYALFLLLLLASCAPVATLDLAAIQSGPGGTAGLTLVSDGRRFSALPYLRYGVGKGDTEIGLVAQVGLGAYVKQRLLPGLSLKAAAHLPGPALEGAFLADVGPVTFSLRGLTAVIDLSGDGGQRLFWWGASAGYWKGGVGLEATYLASEGGALFAFSLARRF